MCFSRGGSTGAHLYPFIWCGDQLREWRFLRAMKTVRTVRVITLGVVPEHRKLGIEMQLMHGVIKLGMAAGFLVIGAPPISSAAARTEPKRATASKARTAFSGGRRIVGPA